MTDSCVALLEKYTDIFDGLDIDLEYPCPPGKICGPDITPSDNDAQYFLSLIQSFRQKMNKDKLLTLATTSNPSILPGLSLLELNPLVDWYNIMTYDYTSGSFGDKMTGHHSKTMDSPDPLKNRAGFSAEHAVNMYVQKGA